MPRRLNAFSLRWGDRPSVDQARTIGRVDTLRDAVTVCDPHVTLCATVIRVVHTQQTEDLAIKPLVQAAGEYLHGVVDLEGSGGVVGVRGARRGFRVAPENTSSLSVVPLWESSSVDEVNCVLTGPQRCE